MQLYAMRYGAVPVAHKTGGLKDTVIDFDPWTQTGTGWTYTTCDAQVRWNLQHCFEQLANELHTSCYSLVCFLQLYQAE
jgi:glycogen synthase